MLPTSISLWLFITTQIYTTKSSYPRIPLACPDVPRLHVIPGFGWDALTNKDTQQLLNITYEQCKVTEDGKFLIPDGMAAVIPKKNDIEVIAELIDHWSKYTAADARGFQTPNEILSPELVGLFSTFSDEYQEMKHLQVKHRVFTTRTQLRQLSYRINSARDIPISNTVKERFLKVIGAIVKNNTEQAEYLIQTIVRDYGTHYSKSVEVGAVFISFYYLPLIFLQDYSQQKYKIVSAAKVSFLDFIGFAWNHKRELDTSLLEEYNNSTIDTIITKIGKPNWEKGLSGEGLASIDRSGNLLTGLITTSNFPNIQPDNLKTLKDLLGETITNYFTRNMHKGCTNLNSPNFDYIANLDDSTCKDSIHDYTLGGVYTSCSSPYNAYHGGPCSGLNLKNPLTGDESCPTGTTLLYYKIQPYTFRVSSYTLTSFNNLTTYYCMIPANSSGSEKHYIFGGLYSKDVVNVQTKERNCPSQFNTLAILEGKLTLCVIENKNQTNFNSLPFGGFTTGRTGLRCPTGYRNHLAVVFDDNEIHYCLQERNQTNYGVRPLLERPPFVVAKGIKYENDIAEDYDYGITVEEDIAEASSGIEVIIYIVITLVIILICLGFGLIYWKRRRLTCLQKSGIEEPVAWTKGNQSQQSLCGGTNDKVERKSGSVACDNEYVQPIGGRRNGGRDPKEQSWPGSYVSGKEKLKEVSLEEDNVYE